VKGGGGKGVSALISAENWGDQRIRDNSGCHCCNETRVEQCVSWRNGAEDFEGIQKQRSTQESRAVGNTCATLCRRRAKIKMKDSTSIYVALASSKREMNLLAEARWCCEGWGEEQLQHQESRGICARPPMANRVSNSQKMMMMMMIY
jgi:hypothetical protein